MSRNNPKRKKGKKSGEPCIVRKSNIPGAGRGVFAKRLIRKGDVVGFYDGIIYNKQQTLFEKAKGSDKTYWIDASHITRYGSECALVGFEEVKNAGGYCQLINDASNNLTVRPLNKYNVEPIYQIKKYMELNGKEKKVGDNPEVLYFQATKRIKKGEELYFNYGKGYWFAQQPRMREKSRRFHNRRYLTTYNTHCPGFNPERDWMEEDERDAYLKELERMGFLMSQIQH